MWVELSLCVPYRLMERGGVDSLFLNLGVRQRWMYSIASRTLYPRCKTTCYPLNMRLDGPWVDLDAVEKRKISRPWGESNHNFSGSSPRRLVNLNGAAPAHLMEYFQLLWIYVINWQSKGNENKCSIISFDYGTSCRSRLLCNVIISAYVLQNQRRETTVLSRKCLTGSGTILF